MHAQMACSEMSPPLLLLALILDKFQMLSFSFHGVLAIYFPANLNAAVAIARGTNEL